MVNILSFCVTSSTCHHSSMFDDLFRKMLTSLYFEVSTNENENELQVAQMMAWKLCRKPFQGLQLGTRLTEKFTQCLTMKLRPGANFSDTSFEPVRGSDFSQFWGQLRGGGLMERTSNAHNLLVLQWNALKFSPFVDRLLYYKLMPMWAWWNKSMALSG